ncbi:hypothetical protein DENSPDRAFT_411835 [Dentipellis sp. KUC8613]|nr:hypothetical protein DENSPDRAFT_411835 [Dentipellis sp. KUC8613]
MRRPLPSRGTRSDQVLVPSGCLLVRRSISTRAPRLLRGVAAILSLVKTSSSVVLPILPNVRQVSKIPSAGGEVSAVKGIGGRTCRSSHTLYRGQVQNCFDADTGEGASKRYSTRCFSGSWTGSFPAGPNLPVARVA